MSAARSRRANDKHNHLQRTPILVMGCSLLIACCIAFGGTNWTASAQPSEDQLPEQNAIVEDEAARLECVAFISPTNKRNHDGLPDFAR